MKFIWLVFWMSMTFVPTAWADCEDNPTPDDDCDGDGFTVAQGDCDDELDTVNPDAEEVCDDGIDNNCDDVIDEGCEQIIETPEGECGCNASPTLSAFAMQWVALLALFWRRRVHRHGSAPKGGVL